jgi:hypothetical protein
MHLSTKLLLYFTITVLFGWQSVYAQEVNMPTGTNTTITCSTAFNDSGGAGGSYGNNENSIHTFTPATAGDKIRVSFSTFGTEGCCDFLEVFNGNSVAAPLLGTFSGGTVPTAITSTAADGSLTFRFSSDESVTGAGWTSTISCIPPPIVMSNGSTTTCEATFTDSGGSSSNYSDNENFTYTFFPATTGDKVRITFTSLSLRNSDVLSVFDGNSIGATQVGSFTGTTAAPAAITSTAADGSLTFRFTSNGSINRPGWVASIECVVPPPLLMPTGGTTTSITTCDATLFDSGGSAGNYLNNGDGTLTIFPATVGDVVRLTFISFATEACCDGLQVFNGNSTAAPSLGIFAGTTLTTVITSSAADGSLTLRFDADGSVNGAGFEIAISCFSPCPIVGGTASISNANVCTGQATTLSLVGQSGSIQWQQSIDGGLSFTNIAGATSVTRVVSPTVSTIYRAEVSSVACVPSSANSTTVAVVVDCIIMPTGTPASVTACNTTLFDSGGSGGSATIDGVAGNYLDNGDGTLTIFPTTVGDVVQLTFISFATEACCDRLQVFNGNSTAAPSLGIFAATILPPVITSSAADGSLTLFFDADGSLNRAGFEIAVSCFNPCPIVGGTATTSLTATCGGENVTLNLTGQTGPNIQWQQSIDGGLSFTNIAGATSVTRVVSPTVNTIYRAVVSNATCTPSSTNSTTVSVAINDCINMPVGPTSVTTCGTTLFDSGGRTGNYSNNENRTLTIFPTTLGTKVTLTFIEFDTQVDEDVLEIFNGNSTGSPSLGSFSGTGIPPVITSTAADGSLTINFISNGGTTRPGWRANIACACGWDLNSFTINSCVGNNPTIYDLDINFSAAGGTSPNYEVYVNGALQITQAYTTNPQSINLTGLVNTNSPLEIELRDALDPACNLTRTLFSAGTDRTVCGLEATLNAQTATGGQWTFVSGPNTPTFSNALNPNALVTGMITGTYTFRWSSIISGGCNFTDEVAITIDDNCIFDTSDPDVGNNCGGIFTSHDTYPANYSADYNQVITLCPEAGQALQLTFDNIDLGTGDNIQIWLSDTEVGTVDLTFDDGDNGRSFTIKSQDVSGCITVRFTSNNNSNVGNGFSSTISCTTPDDPASVDCIGASPLCTDLSYAFPTGGVGGSGTQNGGINNGCASFTNIKWFYFEMAETGDFEFDINPIVPNDDYDFAIWSPFTSYGDIPCVSGNNGGMGLPIRCNFSAIRGVTGLDTAGTGPSQGAGGQVYSDELPVTIGDFYVMMVDDFGNQGNGFNISASTINGNNPTNCSIVDCDAFFGNQVFSSTGSTTFGNNYICYNDAITLGTVDNSYTFGRAVDEEFYFVHSDNPNTPFGVRNEFIINNLTTSDYVTTNLSGVDNNQLTFTNDGSLFADNQIWNIYATTGIASVPSASFGNSCSFWLPFELKLLPEITATIPIGCNADFSVTNINGGLPRFQQDREGGATTTYTVDLLDAGNVVAYTQNVTLGNNANFTGVATGTYTVQITDQNSCPVSLGTVSINSPVYDNFCSAEPVFLGNNGPFTNECATLEVGETGGSCFTGATNQVDQSIWTAFTPTLTSNYLVRIAQGTDATFPITGGLFDSEITIYTNSATCPTLPILTQLACNDNNAATFSVQSEIPTIAMTAGTTYYIQIDGKAFFTGPTYSGSSQADDIILYIEEFDLLPIELKLFDGKVKNEGNLIFWETAMEKDVEYFSLEASVDGITFLEINRQNPNQEPSNYEFLHTEAQQKMYYRLKDVSTTGEQSYSNIIYLVRENIISIEKGLLGIYPNPTLDNITIRMFYPNSEEISLQLYDTKGVELINKMIEIPSSQVIERTLSLVDLPAGVYILSLTTRIGKEVVKIVKQ